MLLHVSKHQPTRSVKAIDRDNHSRWLFINPAASDTGIPLGAALYGYHAVLERPRTYGGISPYLGPSYSAGRITAAIEADAQEANMIRNFSEQVLSGQLNEWWPEAALKTQQVMAKCIEAGKLWNTKQ